MPSLRDCIGKAGKLISPAQADAIHARSKQYLSDGHPVADAERMAVQHAIDETHGHLDEVFRQAAPKPAAVKEDPVADYKRHQEIQQRLSQLVKEGKGLDHPEVHQLMTENEAIKNRNSSDPGMPPEKPEAPKVAGSPEDDKKAEGVLKKIDGIFERLKTGRVPVIPHGENTPQRLVKSAIDAISASPEVKQKIAGGLAEFARRLHAAVPEHFGNMEVHVMGKAEWKAHSALGQQVPDSAAAYDPHSNTLYLNSDKLTPENLASAVVHEGGHFAEKFFLGDKFTQSQWEALTHEQRQAAAEQAKKGLGDQSPEVLKNDARARSEWVAMQWSRVLRGDTKEMNPELKGKLGQLLDVMRDVVKRWIGRPDVTTPELDRAILKMMGYDEAGGKPGEFNDREGAILGTPDEDRIHEAAMTQRNIPEDQMLKSVNQIQKAGVSGMLNHLLEHVGDLSHRLQERGGLGIGAAASKIRLITPADGRMQIADEIRHNLQASAEYAAIQNHPELQNTSPLYVGYQELRDKYPGEIDRELARMKEQIKAPLNDYVRAHIESNQPVTYAGKLGREAAIALGRLDYRRLEKVGRELSQFYNKNRTDRHAMMTTEIPKDSVLNDHKVLGTPEEDKEDRRAVLQAQRDVSQTAKDNPEALRLKIAHDAEGNPKISLVRDEDGNVVIDKKTGLPKRQVEYEKEPYALRNAPGLSQDDAKAVTQAADKLVGEIGPSMKIPSIAAGKGWYSRFRERMQQMLGANNEIFGQLLGATSARTPVHTNFSQSLEAIKMLGQGKYDDLLKRYHDFIQQTKADADSGKLQRDWQAANPNKKASAFVLEDEYRKAINRFKEQPLRENGAKYNMNSNKVLQALYGNWLEQTVGPKTPNYAGNLTGRTTDATIDVWAARLMRRLLYSDQVKKWRIQPQQEAGVDFSVNKAGEYGGDFTFAQKAFGEAAQRLGLSPDDLQAIAWFHEKHLWDKNGWTSTIGAEKSDLNLEAQHMHTRRYDVGLTTAEGGKPLDEAAHEQSRKELQDEIAKHPDLVASRVNKSNGMYMGSSEPTFDTEFTLNRSGDPMGILKKVIEIAQRHNQQDTYISKHVDADHPNARPMMEIGFKHPASDAEMAGVMKAFEDQGISGFTIARDTQGRAIGIRTQYIPEFSGNLSVTEHPRLSTEWADKARTAKSNLNQENIAHATESFVSTHVFGKEEYARGPSRDLFGSDVSRELGRRQAVVQARESGQLPGGDHGATPDQGSGGSEPAGAGAVRGDAEKPTLLGTPEEQEADHVLDSPEARGVRGKIVDAWKKAAGERDLRHTLAVTRDAADNQANKTADETYNSVLHAVQRATPAGDVPLASEALGFHIEAGKEGVKTLEAQRAKLEASEKASPEWKARALAGIDYAIAHYDQLKPAADMYRAFTDRQVDTEQAAGFPTLKHENYVMHAQDVEDGSIFDESGGMSPTGSSNRKNRTFATHVDSISAGIDPKTLNAVDLLKTRVKNGQTGVQLRGWQDSLKQYVDPTTNEPIATQPELVHRADGSVYFQAPHGYKNEMIGGTPVAVKNEYSGIVGALTDPSWLSKDAGRRLVQKVNGAGKSVNLLIDTFHLGRLAMQQSILKGASLTDMKVPLPSYREGKTILENSPQELTRMAAHGEIDKDALPELIRKKQNLDRMVAQGFNSGHIADAMHQEFIRAIPGIGNVNKFIFESFQRGAMSEAALMEYDRQSKAYPELTPDQVARQVAKDINTRFGNLGRQGVFKSKTAQDIARMIFLAPQWNEGLIRSELGGVGQIARSVKEATIGRPVTREVDGMHVTKWERRLAMGALGRDLVAGALGIFVANQIINQATRGKFTWENPEEGVGSKLSAWIPDVVGGQSSGYFLNPMGIMAEISHMLLKKYERTEDGWKTAVDFARSRLSAGGRPIATAVTGETALGQKIRPGDKTKEVLKSAIPVPIGGSAGYQAVRGAINHGNTEVFPGQFQQQMMQSAGLKTETVASPEQRMSALAKKFNETKNIHPDAEFYASDYTDLDNALRRNNEADIRSELEALAHKKSPEEIRDHYRSWQHHPFTGKRAREAEFVRTLNPEQRATYMRAKQIRAQIGARAMQYSYSMPATQPAMN